MHYCDVPVIPKLVCEVIMPTSTHMRSCRAESNQMPLPEEGSVRLRGGFGTPCDPVHSGFVEVFHRSEWGAICSPIAMENVDRLVADVVCRQLGFPHGTIVPALSNLPDSVERYSDGYSGPTEESEEPQGRFWLSRVACRGPEETLLDCDLGPGLRDANRGCEGQRERLNLACRSFPVPEALEALVSPGAGMSTVTATCLHVHASWSRKDVNVNVSNSHVNVRCMHVAARLVRLRGTCSFSHCVHVMVNA